MAVVEPISSIKNHSYLFNSIDYVLSPENENRQEKCFEATCLNCENSGAYGLATQFYVTRSAFKQDKNILAHHYVQSFDKNDDVTPEQAHQLGIEIAKKVAPNFQVIVSTHIDKDHIHNHIIINSSNLKTGLKWKGNNATLENMRRESDKLCVREGLHIVDNRSELKGLDQATRETAKKKISWKIKLCQDLEAAVKVCKSKAEFIEFMESRNYDVDYKDGYRHIVFRNKNFDKKIRADTLAKQFGSMFSKESLEKSMGYFTPAEPVPEKAKKQIDILQDYESEWEKFSKDVFGNTEQTNMESVKNSPAFKKIKSSKFPLLELVHQIFLGTKNKRCDKKYRILKIALFEKTQKSNKYQYAVKRFDELSLEKRLENINFHIGNVAYDELTQTQGDNFFVKVSLSNIAGLIKSPFFFSADVNNTSAIVTVKEKDKLLLAAALGIDDIKLMESHNRQLSNKMTYARIKNEAKRQNVKVEYLTVEKSKLQVLQDKFIDFAYFEKADGKISIAFLPSSKKRIFDLLFNKKKTEKRDDELAQNTEINKELKAIEALGKDERRFRIIEAAQRPLLNELPPTVKFACFRKKDGRINVVYLKSQQAEFERVLQKPQEKKNDMKLKT